MMARQATYHIITFGCQMNERDSQTLAGMLEEEGYLQVDSPGEADVIVLNTCSVRENADQRFFGVLGQMKHEKTGRPDTLVAVCGCMMQQEHLVEDLRRRFPWVDVVLGTHNLHRFPSLLEACRRERRRSWEVWEEALPPVEGLPFSQEEPFRASINIMQGCNNFCTYCIVPYTRGRERSRQPEAILAEARARAREGAVELLLLGQNVNSYAQSSLPEGGYRADQQGGVDFAGLIRLVDQVPGIRRIRFMTSHPKDISPDLIGAFADCQHLCKHIHLPLQSGSDAILARMNRRYSRQRYLDIVADLRRACPSIAITTDIIVGFPGEGPEDFEDTLDLVRQVRFDAAFTFLYSARKGTPAARYRQETSQEALRERFDRLLVEVHGIQNEKNQAYLGRLVSVLVEGESRRKEGVLTGRTDSFKVVDFPGPASLTGQLVPVRITKAGTFSFFGQLEDI